MAQNTTKYNSIFEESCIYSFPVRGRSIFVVCIVSPLCEVNLELVMIPPVSALFQFFRRNIIDERRDGNKYHYILSKISTYLQQNGQRNFLLGVASYITNTIFSRNKKTAFSCLVE